MRADARLDSAVFQLTPTRTRCDLVITANGKTEKIASGLLSPFLAHLKAAKDQIAKGGYSISLQPDPMIDAPWFTKGTVEKFVRFVSTPEVLERVSTIESEILQIEEAITIHENENIGLSTVEDHQTRSLESIEGSKPVLDADAGKNAIVLYKPGSQPNPAESNGSSTQEENSKIQLLRVLETRKIVLQKEQGMAFARATAAGFDMDHMAYLISFAESFGASRLKQACLQFMELWKVKHETGQWLEVEAVDLMSSRSGFSPFNASGIVLSGDTSKQSEFGEAWATKSNGDDLSDLNRDKRLPSDPQIPHGSHEYFQGHFQQPRYPSWPPPGPHGFAPYPVQAMPYYQNYPGNGPFYQPPYPPVEDPRFGTQRMETMRRHSMNSKDSNVDSQDDGLDEILSELEKDGSRGRKSHKRISRSGRKKSGTVVIENLNYISSKKHESSDGESQSVSDSETGEETEDALSDTVEGKHKKSSRTSKKKGHTKSLEKSNTYDNDEMVRGKDADSGNWQAFQSFLLKAEERMSSTVDGDMFAGEKEAPTKRKQNLSEAEPILVPDRNSGDIQETRTMEFDSVVGKASRTRQAASSDEFLSFSGGRGLRDSHLEPHFKEGGGGGYKRVASDDFIVYDRENQTGNHITLDPLGDHANERPANLEKGSYAVTDDSFIVPVRSGLQDQLGTDSRTAIDMDVDFPSSRLGKEDFANKAKTEIIYEPDDSTFMPKRPSESEYIGYDPAFDYDMQIPINVSVKEEESGDQEDISAINKEELRESEKEKKLKVQDGPEKRKKDAMTRRGISSKTSPLTEAQKRAEKLRAYKVDLQKAKKENEEEQRKRLEALKLERQKRIAARSGSNTAQSPSATKQTRNRMPTKLSPSSFKGSKFSDAEPSSHSPLTKLPIRSTSISSIDSQRTMKPSSTTNGLSRSVSSVPELTKESNGVIPEVKVASARLRRLSEPKVINTQHSSQKSGSTNVPKRNVTSEPQMKKITAIMQLDKTKSATLPELKVRTPRAPSDTVQNKSKTEVLQKGAGSKTSSTSSSVLGKKTGEKLPSVSYSDDNPVIEKTVVMLENETVTAPVAVAIEGMACMNDSYVGDHRKGTIGIDSEYAAVRAPPSPVVIDEIEDPNHGKDGQPCSYEVVNDVPKDESQNFSSSSVTENLYQAPFARATSLEHPSGNNLEYSGTPAVLNSGITSMQNESVKARISNFSDPSPMEQIQQTHESSEKPRSKESKGFRKLLKFGRKSHTSASGEGNIDSDGLAADDQAETAPANDVHILKNLISQDDSHAGGAPPKAHRSFSILSPFRSSKTSEKKMAA